MESRNDIYSLQTAYKDEEEIEEDESVVSSQRRSSHFREDDQLSTVSYSGQFEDEVEDEVGEDLDDLDEGDESEAEIEEEFENNGKISRLREDVGENPDSWYECYEILPYLYLSGHIVADTAAQLHFLGIEYVLNVASEAPPLQKTLDEFTVLHLPLHDIKQQNLTPYLEQGYNFIEKARQMHSKILVHCVSGISRSVSFLIYYLMKENKKSLRETFDFVKSCKDDVGPNVSFMRQLGNWEYETTGQRTIDLIQYQQDCTFQRFPVLKSDPEKAKEVFRYMGFGDVNKEGEIKSYDADNTEYILEDNDNKPSVEELENIE